MPASRVSASLILHPVSVHAPVHAVSESGNVPPGNEKGNTTWSLRRAPPKPEIKLTPGKGVQDLACSVEDLVEQVVKSNKVAFPASVRDAVHDGASCVSRARGGFAQVVAFIKGTRTQPQCGFSHKVLTILNEAGAPYEVVGARMPLRGRRLPKTGSRGMYWHLHR